MIRFDRTKGRPEPIRALNLINELENGEPLVDLREIAPSIRMLRPQVIPFVRATVAEMCRVAAESLPAGYHLELVEGWRPFARQQRIYEFMWNAAKEAFPDRNYSGLRRTVCRWVAPVDQKAPPGHCTGAAVDVWLVDDEGNHIDVSSPFDRWKAAPTYALDISDEARKNRMILVEAMLAAGFSNCRDEWWHYSYGDAGWAVRVGEKDCIYGLAELELDIVEQLELEHVESMKGRPNPFIH